MATAAHTIVFAAFRLENDALDSQNQYAGRQCTQNLIADTQIPRYVQLRLRF